MLIKILVIIILFEIAVGILGFGIYMLFSIKNRNEAYEEFKKKHDNQIDRVESKILPKDLKKWGGKEMKLIVYYQGNYPTYKNYESDDWDKTSLEIIDDVLRRGHDGEYELDSDDFDAYRDIIIMEFGTNKDLELSEELTRNQIHEIFKKYF